MELLDDTFEPPAGLESLLGRQRDTTTVRMELTQDARWAARQCAERITVVDEDEETFTADLSLLPPVGQRVGLVLLASGTPSRLVSVGSVLPEALGLVEELLAHHRSIGPPQL